MKEHLTFPVMNVRGVILTGDWREHLENRAPRKFGVANARDSRKSSYPAFTGKRAKSAAKAVGFPGDQVRAWLSEHRASHFSQSPWSNVGEPFTQVGDCRSFLWIDRGPSQLARKLVIIGQFADEPSVVST